MLLHQLLNTYPSIHFVLGANSAFQSLRKQFCTALLMVKAESVLSKYAFTVCGNAFSSKRGMLKCFYLY